MKKTLLVLALLLIAAAAAFLTLGGGFSKYSVSDREFAQLNKLPSPEQLSRDTTANNTAHLAYAEGDYETAHKQWLDLAKKETAYTPAAQYYLGKLYANGQGVKQNDSTARDWWQKANGGNDDALLLLDALPANPDPQYTYATLHEKWQPAAAAGDADAQYKLAALYLTGVGVSQNADEALNWFEKAANQNHAAAQYQIGRLYDSFNIGPRDEAKAREWWEKAATLGNADAQTVLGIQYSIDSLLDHNSAQKRCKAIGLWEQAVAQGHSRAKTLLAPYYKDGDAECGIIKDTNKARALLEEAIANGSKAERETAKTALYRLERDTE